MRLVALHIMESFLFEEPQTINFGGFNSYEIKSEESKIRISKKAIKNFNIDFYGDKISSISAIVGKNGSGKTSLIKEIFTDENLIIIYENNAGEIFVTYAIKSKPKPSKHALLLDFEDQSSVEFDISKILEKEKVKNKVLNISKIQPYFSFFSPLSNYDISIRMFDSFVVDADNIYEINSKNIQRNIELLSRKGFVEKIKDIYDDFPTYENILIEAKGMTERKLLEMDLMFYEMYFSKSSTQSDEKFSGLDRETMEINMMKLISDGHYVAVFSKFSDIFGRKTRGELSNITVQLYIRFLSSLFLAVSLDSLQKISTDLIPLIKYSNFTVKENFNLLLKKTREIGFKYSSVKDKRYSNKTYFIDIEETVAQFLKLLPNDMILYLHNMDKLDFQKLFSAYNKLLYSFKSISHELKMHIEWPFLEFTPNYHLSQGEQYLLNLFSSIYSGADDLRTKLNHVIFLDEPDLGFHPMWKKKFINAMVKLTPLMFDDFQQKLMDDQLVKGTYKKKEYSIQIIFTTHDPLTLSDILNYNVVYLDKIDNELVVLGQNDSRRPKNSFASNINDLLADSFFIEDGLVGDFAITKINRTIAWLNKKLGKEYDKSIEFLKIEEDDKYHLKIIESIGEQVVKTKLKRMYMEAITDDEMILKEIQRLQSKLNRDD